MTPYTIILFVVCASAILIKATYEHALRKGQRIYIRQNGHCIAAGDKRAEDFSFFSALRFETMRIVFDDGVYAEIFSVEPHKIIVSVQDILDMSQAIFKRPLSNIKLIIHNHLENAAFSECDKEMFGELRRLGWRGKFLLWHRGEISEL